MDNPRKMSQDGITYELQMTEHRNVSGNVVMNYEEWVRVVPTHAELEDELYPDDEAWQSFDGGPYLADIHRKTTMSAAELEEYRRKLQHPNNAW